MKSKQYFKLIQNKEVNKRLKNYLFLASIDNLINKYVTFDRFIDGNWVWENYINVGKILPNKIKNKQTNEITKDINILFDAIFQNNNELLFNINHFNKLVKNYCKKRLKIK